MTSRARRILHSVTHHDPSKAYPGYTLIIPFWWQDEAYLIDMQGRIVQFWKLPKRPGDVGFLLENGNLFYPARYDNNYWNEFIGGSGSDIIEVDWDNNIVWSHTDLYTHHTMERMANGNTMVLRFVPMPLDISDKVIGGRAGTEANGKMMWTDELQEVTPDGKVVWQWKAYEHLDPKIFKLCPYEGRFEWTHCNTVKELPNGDMLLSFRCVSAIVIIDKKTGDVKWHYGPGGQLAHPHDPSMLDNGNVLVFDNGSHRHSAELSYSRALEIDPKTNEIVWQYTDEIPTEFFSGICSSCQRLPNGNTLINECDLGRTFEVTQDKEIVWEFINPFYTQTIGSVMMENSDLGKNNMVHRATRYAPDYPGLAGKDLNPDRFKVLNQMYGPDAFPKAPI